MEPRVFDFTVNYPKVSIPFKVGYRELLEFYQNLEPQTKQYYCDIVQKDWNIVDVGANIGMFSLLFGKLASQGQVIAIEASEENFDMLKTNIENAGLDNIRANNSYISNKTENVEGEIHYLWTGRGSVSRSKGIFPFMTLDYIFETYKEPIHLIKIDIDGYDFEAVQGATEVMKTHKPIVVIELVDEALRMHGFVKSDVINFMNEHGYHQDRILDNCNYVFFPN